MISSSPLSLRLATALLVFLLPAALAERLPVRVFDTSSGLAHNRVNCILQTSEGFLWFCTDDGLSRFDGQTFVNFTRADGLPHAHVNAMVASPSGTLWLATDGGLVRFHPNAGPGSAVFETFRLPADEHVNALAEDHDGVLWCATDGGLYRAAVEGALTFQKIALPWPQRSLSQRDAYHVTSVFIDSHQRLWAGTVDQGGFWRRPNGPWRWFQTSPHLASNFIDAFWEDRSGAVWAGTRYGGAARVDVLTEEPFTIVRHPVARPAAGVEVRAALATSDGALWVAGSGLAYYPSSTAPLGDARKYSLASGLTDFNVLRLAEDNSRNLWLGTHHSGVLRMPLEGFRTYSEQDGFVPGDEQSLLVSPQGGVCIWSGAKQIRSFHCLDHQRFVPVELPASGRNTSSGDTALVDRSGLWWFPTEAGIRRFARFPRFTASAIPGLPDGLFVSTVFEDSQDDVWIGAPDRILHWRRSTSSFREVFRSPTGRRDLEVSAFAEPVPGVIIIAQRFSGSLLRYRLGRIEYLPPIPSVEMIHHLFADAQHRLWVATSGAGLVRVEEPAAPQPRFQSIAKAEGLSSNDAFAIVSDRWGRIHVATAAGVDRLSPDGRFLRAFSAADGLASGRILAALRDRSGDLWFTTSSAVSRLTPLPEAPARPPQVRLSALRIGGRAIPVSHLGASSLGPFELGAADNQIQIEFLGIDMRSSARLLFQTSVTEGEPEWSRPSPERTMSLNRLVPGSYTFRVRAVNEAGVPSPQPATITFHILPPFWRSWWFVLGLTGCAAGLAYSFHRARVARVVELERIRARISADLHDDIGSTLSRMVLMSEAARARLSSSPADSARLLEQIAATGRESLDSISDIVWAIDPRRDMALDLSHRIREFTGAALEGSPVKWELTVSGDASGLPLDPQVRRQAYLIYKEAIRNAIRHSCCSELHLTLAFSPTALSGEITDDGHGIRPDAPPGNGLANMQSRVQALLGRWELRSSASEGTSIRFSLPLTPRRNSRGAERPGIKD